MFEIPVVHCVDTEGPLNETDYDSWLRVRDLCQEEYKINFVKRVLQGDYDNYKNAVGIKNIINQKTMNYVRNLDEHSEMLDGIFSSDFRNQTQDSYGGNYKFSWFVMDHINYKTDDRNKLQGYHKIFDIFSKRISENALYKDTLEFHFHSNSPSYHSSHSNTFWLRDNKIFDIILHRLIDRQSFPIISRPGFHAVSPDSHWFLEQYIPFEFANQSLALDRNERFSDWSRAPKTWEGYNPSHDDYQKVGDCRRKIFSCLNIGTRHSVINRNHVQFAINEVKNGKKPIIAITNHDFREMKDDVKLIDHLLNEEFNKHENVKFIYCNAREALGLNHSIENFDYTFEGFKKNILKITTNDKLFGPSPFFGYKTIDNRYIFDNLTIVRPHFEWIYHFDDENINITNISKIGIAANHITGKQKINVIELNQYAT